MEKKYYLPAADNERATWLTTFATGVAALPVTWGTAVTGMVASVQADANAFKYELDFLEAAEKFFHSSTANKNELRNGPTAATVLALPVFTPPAGAPTLVKPGIFPRAQLFVGQLKKNNLYTPAIGAILGVIGEDRVLDFSTAQPALTLLQTGGLVNIKYKLDHTDGLYLFSMRGAETVFTLLATITKASFNDTRPNLIVGQPEKRQYRAFYMVGDVMVGIESAIVSIMV